MINYSKIIFNSTIKRFGYLLERDGITLDTTTKEFTGKFIPPKKEIRKITPRISPNNPNKSELQLWEILNEYFPYTYEYVGNFQVNIGRRFPDFINTNGIKEVIELFGSYWHIPEEVRPTIDHYKQYGFSCIVIWEEELVDPIGVVNHIKCGSLHTPIYKGNTFLDYIDKKEHINHGCLLDPLTRLMANISLMLIRATFIQKEYSTEPRKLRKPKGRSIKLKKLEGELSGIKSRQPIYFDQDVLDRLKEYIKEDYGNRRALSLVVQCAVVKYLDEEWSELKVGR